MIFTTITFCPCSYLAYVVFSYVLCHLMLPRLRKVGRWWMGGECLSVRLVYVLDEIRLGDKLSMVSLKKNKVLVYTEAVFGKV